ncbi:MAG: hypothetical protein IJ662_12530 [Clostridia bacterium]|nr:hypothetical protein [Clostridia bacterium]
MKLIQRNGAEIILLLQAAKKRFDKTKKEDKIINTACGYQRKSGCGQRFSCVLLRLPQRNQLAVRRIFFVFGQEEISHGTQGKQLSGTGTGRQADDEVRRSLHHQPAGGGFV